MNNIDKTAEERITQSRVRLLLTKPFFGQLAVRLKVQDATEWLPTAATDGRRFMFNRDFVDSLNDDMLDFLVGHEVLHCVFDHMQARGDRKPQLYNAAADYNINMTLVEQNIGMTAGNLVFDSMFYQDFDNDELQATANAYKTFSE
jgi:predicted metal-dependent peptidase